MEKKIINDLIKTSLKVSSLFLQISITKKKGEKKIIGSHIRHSSGKKIKISELIIFLSKDLPEKNIDITKKRKINISFLPKASSSAIGYKRKMGENKAKN